MKPTLLKSSNWLHPATWLIIILAIKYVAPIFTGEVLVTTQLLPYLALVVLFCLPIWLTLQKMPILVISGQFYSSNFVIETIWSAIILVIVWHWDSWNYPALNNGTPMLLQIMVVGLILSSSLLLHKDVIERAVIKTLLVIVLEWILLFHIGMRDWMVLAGLLTLFSVHQSYKPIQFKHLLLVGVLFVGLVAPFSVILRTALYDPAFNEKPVVQIKHELRNYDEHVTAALNRIGAEGVMLSKAIAQKEHLNNSKRIVEWRQLTYAAILPSKFRNDTTTLRPGVTIYETYFQEEAKKNDQAISYPSGIIGDTVYYFGYYAWIILPLLGILLALIWRFIAPVLLGLHTYGAMLFFYLYIFWDTHLIFLQSSWFRGVVIIGGWVILIRMFDTGITNWLGAKNA
ncbi:MAG: hypothetical protein ACQETE_11830 [Bacteroidota bacterium]